MNSTCNSMPKTMDVARILIIDDDYSIRKILRLLLEREGYDVFEAPDGDVGLKIQEAESVDLVITDIFMPEKEGLETILEFKTGLIDIKIIAISGGGLRGTDPNLVLGIAKEMGADRILNKPISVKNLLETVSEILTS